jgi:hypothetical protein
VPAKPLLPAPLDRIQLSVGGDAPLAGYGGEEDPGVMDWRGEATVTVYPQDEGDEPGGAWWDQEGAALGTGVAGDGLKVTILRATGAAGRPVPREEHLRCRATPGAVLILAAPAQQWPCLTLRSRNDA